MNTILQDKIAIGGTDCSMELSQTCGLTRVMINKYHPTKGYPIDQKHFCFTEEEFEMFIKCLEANDNILK